MPGRDEKARRERRAATAIPGVDRPRRLNVVALHRRRLILAKAIAERREQQQPVSGNRPLRWALWAAALLAAALAAGQLAGVVR
jgi:hypothetical protein